MMEDGEHTTETEEIVDDVVVPVPPTEPSAAPCKQQQATTPQITIPGDPSSIVSRMCFPRSGLMRGDAGKTHGPQDTHSSRCTSK